MSDDGRATPALTWRIKERAGFTSVELTGDIDEHAGLAALASLSGKVVFQLSGVRRINSMGVREWVNFVRALPGVTELVLTQCSPAFIAQLNMIHGFAGPAKVHSFFAPYVCERCNREELKLLEVATHFPDGCSFDRVPELRCEQCGLALEFDDIPEHYLQFLA
jgi:anti-anti-sigma regulatory factor